MEQQEKWRDEMAEKKQVQKIAVSYYARKDIQKAIYDFCQNREVVPRYLEGFGKRPDALDFPQDILNYAKKGATSFHCSEELWSEPLKISKELTPGQLNELKIGWDFLIDIDSPFLDYSKIAAELIVKAFEYHGIKNIGIKFSGSKGFHLIIPWKAFPKEVYGEQAKDMFPEWPRLIAGYIHEFIKGKLNERILEVSDKRRLEKEGEIISQAKCPKCNNETDLRIVSKYSCPNCRTEMVSMTSSRKVLKCPNCKYDMVKNKEEEIYFCNRCKINSSQIEWSRSSFGDRKVFHGSEIKEEETTKSQRDSVDIVLVSSRHLFRAPYSLHEKTALASIVVDKDEIKNFNPQMANPLKVQIKNFIPDCEEGEARELLLQALDWQKKKFKKETKEFTGKAIDVKNLQITESMFPDCIKKLLGGMKQDGRKRALFILLSFFSSLSLSRDFIEEKLEKWNEKNYKPLPEGYIKSQIEWALKNKLMPPNCDKPHYKELGVKCADCISRGIKNPINYTIREALRFSGTRNISGTKNNTQNYKKKTRKTID